MPPKDVKKETQDDIDARITKAVEERERASKETPEDRAAWDRLDGMIGKKIDERLSAFFDTEEEAEKGKEKPEKREEKQGSPTSRSGILKVLFGE